MLSNGIGGMWFPATLMSDRFGRWCLVVLCSSLLTPCIHARCFPF